MGKKFLITLCLIVLVALFVNHQTAFAHESVTVGDYTIEVGWLDEPPVVGQQNAIVVNVSKGEDEEPVEDVSTLEVSIAYGGQSRTLTLQPLGEDTPGQFAAPILPTVPGEYKIIFGGKLGDTDVNVDVHPEEVQGADTLQFPSVAASQGGGGSNWLVWLSLLIGLVSLGVGVTALRKASTR